ncbi:hypothetical protein D9M71_515680 [compost metagenome]
MTARAALHLIPPSPRRSRAGGSHEEDVLPVAVDGLGGSGARRRCAAGLQLDQLHRTRGACRLPARERYPRRVQHLRYRRRSRCGFVRPRKVRPGGALALPVVSPDRRQATAFAGFHQAASLRQPGSSAAGDARRLRFRQSLRGALPLGLGGPGEQPDPGRARVRLLLAEQLEPALRRTAACTLGRLRRGAAGCAGRNPVALAQLSGAQPQPGRHPADGPGRQAVAGAAAAGAQPGQRPLHRRPRQRQAVRRHGLGRPCADSGRAQPGAAIPDSR